MDDDDDELDLLDEIGESTGTAWKPADDEDAPRKIQGRVTFIGEIEKDQKYGGGYAPLIEITPRRAGDPGYGEVDAWSVRGYHGVLAGKIQRMLDNGMKVGDVCAIGYLGPTEGKNNTYENYDGKFAASK